MCPKKVIWNHLINNQATLIACIEVALYSHVPSWVLIKKITLTPLDGRRRSEDRQTMSSFLLTFQNFLEVVEYRIRSYIVMTLSNPKEKRKNDIFNADDISGPLLSSSCALSSVDPKNYVSNLNKITRFPHCLYLTVSVYSYHTCRRSKYVKL